MSVLVHLEWGNLCWGMHATFIRTGNFTIFAVGATCEKKFTKFISLNFTLYMRQMILPKRNIHQIVKPPKISTVKISSPTVAVTLAKRYTWQDVLNHTLCDMSCITDNKTG